MEAQTLNTVLSLCDEMEALLTQVAPVADPQRLRKIEFACARLCGHDNYVTEKANKIARLAAIYLSARKHQREPRGADGVMYEMRYSLLGAIREQARFLAKGIS